MELNICHLYPDILNLYGDRGNIITMKRRLEGRGIKVNIDECSIGQPLNADKYDIFFIGGGQDFEQEVLLRDLSSGKAQDIRTAVEEEKTFLAICGGYQMLGEYYKTWDGVQLDFIGAIGVHTIGAKERMIGNYMFRTTPESGDTVVVGFENHSGKTYLSEQVAPLGMMLSGNGNNGEDKTEGARYKNVFGTYSHGSLLPKNPVLCDFILQTALNHRYDGAEPLAPLDDTLELNAHRYMQERLSHNG
ncbi:MULTISPECIES: glutamine amidotransferase [Agathobaculum]|jgi:CobQ-like glutamine amidotransferase family enzyme|uniref:Lipid II isoglutaminyl synthase (glutamine-hydrolyzing) subunit GatD n=1 Tax=Agathobaculum hominis TaxID=2763014 RepID=A0ABR7GMQ6_9FIRM|nr:glutamine amidotransferase [Agathobaculum hominis]MEE0388644.1 glutamine amidotransferase [Agathobaculum sp.]RHS84547.1 glutamine amidotransferase [Butyricicoccus sp. AM42-5AC]RHT56387.1 glutamine amidotransferase [Butyricicoccus sp. AM29-23AC]RHV41423.1 glutamine amidotransferase [Butyricicoccus sp. OM04-18BH]MBC5695602.1 glutamine amidotransferase [Agathobaculum hominis]